MEPKEKKAFEPTGLVPRSIVRTFERFRQQLLPGSERAAIREYRISRYQVLVSARCLFALLTIPIATNWFVSSWLLSPIIEHYWNTQQNEIFLNSYQEERAFAELEFFSNKLFFESLLSNQNDDSKNPKRYQAEKSFNIEIAKRKSFPEDNQRLLFLNIEELRRPFSRSPYTQFCKEFVHQGCKENYLVKAVGRDRMGPEQELLYDAPEVQRRWELRLPLLYVHQRCKESRCIVNDAEKIVHPDIPSGLMRCIARCKAWKAGEMQGEQPLVKIVSSNKLESKVNQIGRLAPLTFAPKVHMKEACAPKVQRPTTAGEQNADNEPIEGTEEFNLRSELEFASCTNRVNLMGNFSSQTGYRRQTPESEDLMRQLKLNTLVSNMQKVQILKSRQAIFVERQLHYSAPFSGNNSRDQFLDILNTNNTENSVKIKERIQEKIVELAVYYNEQTILSITNIAGDFISVLTLGFLFIWMKPEISILKSFLIEAIYSLSDTTKSFLLILLTDLLVGFHSPRGWETALELLLKHFGLPENQDFVFLFVATFPVLLDTVFKYWIFRHLNKISPSTVATYHSMIE